MWRDVFRISYWKNKSSSWKIKAVKWLLQANALSVTNFSDKKLLVTIITNLDTSLQSKKIIGY